MPHFDEEETISIQNGNYTPGYHTVMWSGRDEKNKDVPSGIYFYRIQTNDGYSETRKMIMLK